ncbi:MAG: FAD-dependent oxidoreductase [Actinomycetota bacterium]
MTVPPGSHRPPGPHRPRRVAVIGAGMVGLSTAWFLQSQGIEVTVLERTGVAAGASHGNAGWITPALVAPLPDPVILREGLRALALRSSAVHVPLPPGPALLAWLASFARHCTRRQWEAGLASLAPLGSHALSSFDQLATGGVAAASTSAPVLAAYASASQRAPLLAELTAIGDHGGAKPDYEILDGAAVQQAEAVLTGAARAAVRLHGQRYIDPGSFVRALAASVRQRGGEITAGAAVSSVRDDGPAVMVSASTGESRHDAVVLATGAWLGEIAPRLGLRTRTQPGRGYSFSVPVQQLPAGPVYLPAQRLACTPLPDGMLRVAGVMEFRPPEAALDRSRVARMASGLQVMLAGADIGARQDEWVGARPCTPDGLPVIGRTRSERIFVAGGHGMWGITLGPATGQLLASLIATGTAPPELAPFDPLR